MTARLELELCYYTGEWSQSEKVATKSIFESEGWSVVGESIGLIESADPQQILQLIVSLGEEIGHVALDKGADAILAALFVSLHRLFEHFRKAGRKPPTVTVDVVEIRYIVISEEQIDSILEDLLRDGRLKGEKWWRDGRWKTFEEIYPDV